MSQYLKSCISDAPKGLVPPGTRYECTMPHTSVPVRLDRFLAQSFPFYSRSFFKRLIDEGCVTINGKKINKQGTLLKPADTLMLLFPKEQVIDPTVVLEKTENITIVALNQQFIIINKPAGITVHRPHSSYTNPTVADWVLLHYQDISQIGYIDRPGIVHRLDNGTSGLMIIARTNYAHTQLSTLFQNRAIDKTYVALVEGHPPAQGSIDFPIGRHPFHRNKMAVFNCDAPHSFSQKSDRIRDALTEYRVVCYYETCALVEIKPKTGRTHQIRIHFAALGYPLVGDLLYGNKKSQLIQRHALHAQEISFYFDGQWYNFRSEPPADFIDTVKAVQS